MATKYYVAILRNAQGKIDIFPARENVGVIPGSRPVARFGTQADALTYCERNGWVVLVVG